MCWRLFFVSYLALLHNSEFRFWKNENRYFGIIIRDWFFRFLLWTRPFKMLQLSILPPSLCERIYFFLYLSSRLHIFLKFLVWILFPSVYPCSIHICFRYTGISNPIINTFNHWNCRFSPDNHKRLIERSRWWKQHSCRYTK